MEFSTERLERLFEEKPPSSAEEANVTILEAVAAFAGGRAQSDDITCLALHRRRGA